MNCETCTWGNPETCKVCKGGVIKVPFWQLVKVANDPHILAQIISTSYNSGIQTGHAQALRNTNQMFRGYNKVSIES